MSKKRFSEHHLLECQMIFDNVTERGYYFNGEQVDIDDVKYLVDLLNSLAEENEQLKSENVAMKDEQNVMITYLKRENERLQKQLNIIQNLITNAIQHQKTELGQKVLKEVISDYNDWLLGHKEDC